VPHRVPNLAQTRHTKWGRDGKPGSVSTCRRTEQSAAQLFPGGHTHDKMVGKEPRFGPFAARPRPSRSSVQLRHSILSVCDKPFPNPFEVWALRPAGGEK
jgi:hypothetical protein